MGTSSPPSYELFLGLNIASQAVVALQWVVFTITVRRARASWSGATRAKPVNVKGARSVSIATSITTSVSSRGSTSNSTGPNLVVVVPEPAGRQGGSGPSSITRGQSVTRSRRATEMRRNSKVRAGAVVLNINFSCPSTV